MHDKKPIKAVGFDYGGVLGGVGYVGSEFTERVASILGVDVDTYKDVYFGMNNLVNLGEIESWDEFWKLFVEKLGKQEKYQEVVALNHEFESYLHVIDDDALKLVDRLRDNGYKVGLLSNTTLESARKMRENGLAAHFDAFQISAEIKLMKPDPRAFQSLAEELKVDLQELAFVDDAEKSLSRADEIGFVPVLYTSLDDVRSKLHDLGVQVD